VIFFLRTSIAEPLTVRMASGGGVVLPRPGRAIRKGKSQPFSSQLPGERALSGKRKRRSALVLTLQDPSFEFLQRGDFHHEKEKRERATPPLVGGGAF